MAAGLARRERPRLTSEVLCASMFLLSEFHNPYQVVWYGLACSNRGRRDRTEFPVLPAGRAGVGADERRHLPAAAVASFRVIHSRHISGQFFANGLFFSVI